MSRIIIYLNYLSAFGAIALGFVAVDIYSDQQEATKILIKDNAEKTEALYVALTGHHGIRLSNQKASN